VNEIEGAQLSGVTEPRKILAVLRQRFPKAHVLLTLGPEGAMAANDDGIEVVPAYPAKVVDTTAAGDTFIGFFLATRRGGAPLRTALEFASAAAALCCTRHGAADAIPTLQEVREFVK
jgi:ribokinase